MAFSDYRPETPDSNLTTRLGVKKAGVDLTLGGLGLMRSNLIP